MRGQLTMLYGGLFLICGAALPAITYVLVSGFRIVPLFPCRSRQRTAIYQRLAAQLVALHLSFVPTAPTVPMAGVVIFATEGPSDPFTSRRRYASSSLAEFAELHLCQASRERR